jgi:hypothetical protein
MRMPLLQRGLRPLRRAWVLLHRQQWRCEAMLLPSLLE